MSIVHIANLNVLNFKKMSSHVKQCLALLLDYAPDSVECLTGDELKDYWKKLTDFARCHIELGHKDRDMKIWLLEVGSVKCTADKRIMYCFARSASVRWQRTYDEQCAFLEALHRYHRRVGRPSQHC